MTIDSPNRVRYVADARQLPIPQSLEWLSAAERDELSFWSNEPRRVQWLAGRWIAKRMIARSASCVELREIEVLSRGKDGLGKSPQVSLHGFPHASRLSISHCGNSILVGYSGKQTPVGVDLAVDVPQTDSFLAAWYSQNERNWIGIQPTYRAAVLWGLKESIFKACGEGRKWNPAAIAIDTFDDFQVRGQIQGHTLPPLRTWFRNVAGGVATAVWCCENDKEVALCS
ncbi:4'-phosphopantetheinyl transferase family protein [Blastopirellula marina]|uniref:4'-phosphopantetheinyl transferase domain-containing protein n=1 Tax=Blastopirellula marina TaxID=124 RepID=A0A2S8GE35_9BACT|nr:4'-phosphopantetheinyl transferase superfamily protein [Blastopirellula marina]PQO42354.1 hypothetical protein C5Y93_28895 [Blastopirellula marina]